MSVQQVQSLCSDYFQQDSASYSSPITYLDICSDQTQIEFLRSFFEKGIKALYGPQEDTLEGIYIRRSLHAHMYYYNGMPSGIAIYSKEPGSTYQEFIIKESLDIRHLRLFDPSVSAHKGIMLTMLQNIIADAIMAQADYVCIRLNELESHLLRFLSENRFVAVDSKNSTYIEGTKEFFLAHKILTLDSPPQPLSPQLAEPPRVEVRREPPKKIARIASTSSPERTLHVAIARKCIHLIKSGDKTVEGRLCSKTFSHLQKNSLIQFCSWTTPFESVLCRIDEIIRYSSFEEMLDAEGEEKCLPPPSASHRNSRGSPERLLKYGVIALHFHVEQ